MTKQTENTREIALQVIIGVLEKGEYSHLMLKNTLDKYGYLEKQERSFIARLVNGTIERAIELDYIINQFSKTKVPKMKPMIRSILRMSVYQIFYMENVPDNAACNEAVKLAKAHKFQSLSGFVNGVLRNIARQKDEISYPDAKKDQKKYLSVKYSMPEWIVTLFLEQYKLQQVEDIFEGFLCTRPLYVRYTGTDVKSWIKELEASKITYRKSEKLPYAYMIENVDRVELLPGYFEGDFVVQDLGSMIITDKARIKEGDCVIDVCGAPGGKALHAASIVGESGHISVRDLSENKVSLIEENIDRSGLDNIEAKVWDATVFCESDEEKADVVIADLPCSGLGVISRKSEIKYRMSMDDIVSISLLQRKILSTIYKYVKVGGTLMYSTCTLTQNENQDNVKWFIENFPFELQYEETLFPTGEKNVDSTDGFFMARLVRTS